MMSKKMLGLMVAFAVVVAACGSSASKAKSTDTTTTTTTTTTAGSTDAASTTLQLVNTTLGKVVADSDGKVLYLYVPDGTSTVSKVSAGTLAAWPPVKATGVPTLGPGLTAKSSTGTQPNGEKWVMYNGHLLYRFTGDTKAGDVNGNGLANIWYAVTAAGEPVQS
jgi:predicted lipoprotein with Yx(FWY)xxD motif